MSVFEQVNIAKDVKQLMNYISNLFNNFWLKFKVSYNVILGIRYNWEIYQYCHVNYLEQNFFTSHLKVNS